MDSFFVRMCHYVCFSMYLNSINDKLLILRILLILIFIEWEISELFTQPDQNKDRWANHVIATFIYLKVLCSIVFLIRRKYYKMFTI